MNKTNHTKLVELVLKGVKKQQQTSSDAHTETIQRIIQERKNNDR